MNWNQNMPKVAAMPALAVPYETPIAVIIIPMQDPANPVIMSGLLPTRSIKNVDVSVPTKKVMERKPPMRRAR
jgi:hypothetical protein